MLSTEELRRIRRRLENNPTKNVKRRLKKQLKEHKYASTYPKFVPLSHRRYFINRKTDEETLVKLTEIIRTSNIFLLDTESVLVHQQPNRPSLIQLQIILHDALPIVLIVEVNHLPSINSYSLQLIKQIFEIILNSNNIIYTWGTIDELNEFIRVDLFDHEQIATADNRNLQETFKQYWQLNHQHQNTNSCKCEECIGKDPNEKWSLQDAVAYQLNEWLDKRHTCSAFNMGLDLTLDEYTTEEIEIRKILTDYAANDCLSMEKLMINMQENMTPEFEQIMLKNKTDEIDEIIADNIDLDVMNRPTQVESTPPNSNNQPIRHDRLKQRIEREQYENSRSESEQQTQNEQYNLEQNKNPPLSEIRNKKKYKNRMSTLKQRKRHYKHEIILRGIDHRFSVTMVKETLRQYDVPFNAINISKSSFTGRTSLYIGIRNPSRLREYYLRIRNSFNADNYNQIRNQNRPEKSSQIQQMNQ